jgi:EAL domain-containing protein (putative c-di-GMP-specific phosphodiesterase class I)
VHARVRHLREMGFRIAIDDIGAGYAGLTSFAMLEPEVVKLDMALVRDVHKTGTKQKLVRSLVHLCEDLGIQLIAEGVENGEERDALLSLGCNLFQGYHFARPGPPFADVTW